MTQGAHDMVSAELEAGWRTDGGGTWERAFG